MKTKRPFIPPGKTETIRHQIVSLLMESTLTAKEISAEAGVAEKEVYDHLEHIRHGRRELHLVVTPPVCRNCGFIFGKRDRLSKPGKCPVCRHESISAPSFSIERRDG